jgi:hypothetical protein
MRNRIDGDLGSYFDALFDDFRGSVATVAMANEADGG